ncbi:hypothetical protein L6019_RS23335 [Escherichia coli]|nr:hypothetical protein [Escherichia coli]EKG7113487.1 hypothetical protein [Escherichia coli]EKR4920315.1 hypothetical protein [Escherichia coli]ELM8776582.1 hypothetical protein [Escherichia coli]EMA4402794.1 hypothetical protein [Escherichia coli]
MGFPSPAKDYAESTLTINRLCEIDANSMIVETTTGYAVVNRAMVPTKGNVVLIAFCGRNQFARVLGNSLITDDGESLEGDVLDDVSVAGVVTFTIVRTKNAPCDDLPVM